MPPDTSKATPHVLTDASAIVTGLALPLGMFVANKSAAFMVVLAAVLAVAGVWASGRLGEMRRRLSGCLTPLPLAGLMFVGLAALSIGWSHVPKVSVQALGEFLLPLTAALLLALAYAVAPPRRLGLLLALGIGLAAIGVMVDLRTGMAFRRAAGLRPDLFVSNRTVVVLLLLLPPMALLLRGAQRWLALVPAGLVVAAILVSESGAAKLGLAACVALGLVGWIAPRAAVLVLAAGTLALLAFAPVIGTVADKLLPSHAVLAAEDAHAGDRIAIWQSFGAAVQKRPVLGSGFAASTRMADDPVAGTVAEPLRRMLGAGHPHNAFLQIWVELGGLGALVAAALIALLCRAMLDLDGMARRLAIGLGAATLSIWAVSHGAWQAWWIAAVGASVVLLHFGAQGEKHERF